MKKKIAIIGAGWFGCHIAHQLKKLNKFDIKLYEKEKDIFLGASSNNQNRLHLGFHYPRSKETRLQSKNGFDKFLKYYPFLTKKIKYNIYGISDSPETLLDYDTFLQIMKSEKLKFKEIDTYKKFKILGLSGSILTNERLVDDYKSKLFFKRKLKNIIKTKKKIKSIRKINRRYLIEDKLYDYIINCTYFQEFVKHKDIKYEVTSSIIYKAKNNFPALTIMDGPFFTIYPYRKNLYNIYSVEHSRFGLNKDIKKVRQKMNNVINNPSFLHGKRKKIEKIISKYYPLFQKEFKFKKYLVTIRTINNTKFADRSFKIFFKDGFINVFSGKIDHITNASDRILKYLK